MGNHTLAALLLGAIPVGVGWGILSSNTACTTDMHTFVLSFAVYHSIATAINAVLVAIYVTSYIEKALVNVSVIAIGCCSVFWQVVTGFGLFSAVPAITVGSILIARDECPGTNYRKWTLALVIMSSISLLTIVLSMKGSLKRTRTQWELVKALW